VRGDDDLGASVYQTFEGRECCTDTAVIGDGLAVEWNVEVRADEYTLAAKVAEICNGLHRTLLKKMRFVGTRTPACVTRRVGLSLTRAIS
jgi:hypothetical protein